MALKTVGSSPITHPIQKTPSPVPQAGEGATQKWTGFIRPPSAAAHSVRHGTNPPLPDNGMSPSGKAPDFDSGIRRFESCHPSQKAAKRLSGQALGLTIYDPLAQPVEQLPFKQWVRGSSPRRVTSKRHCSGSAFCNDIRSCRNG